MYSPFKRLADDFHLGQLGKSISLTKIDGYILAVGLFLIGTGGPGTAADTYGAPPSNVNAYITKLASAYPNWIEGYNGEHLILKNGDRFPISDHKTDKSFDELLERPDIDDMFYVPYPAGTEPKQPPKNFDPGRVRYGPLFVAMYGDCEKNEVTSKLREIEWLSRHGGGRVAVTTVNGVDKALEAVSRLLDELPIDFVKFLKPTAGTYNCRAVAGSHVRSMHAYGAAIDINSKYSDYWRWAPKNASNPIWKNQIPTQIVRIFEQHGFIWGGYWYHFDTMHFEYRPELLPSRPPS
jgi:D-alanyl-D-alanine carboxypeptidase